MTAHVRAAVTVAAPADRTWALLTDWERQGEWVPFTRVWSEDGDRIGGRISARTGVGRVGFLDTMEIAHWDPPHLCVARHTGRLVRGVGVFSIQPVGVQRCRVVWEEHLDLPFGVVGRIGWLVVRPLARTGLGWALRRFAALARPAAGA